VTLFEFLSAATGAGIVAPDITQWIADRGLHRVVMVIVIAIRTVYMIVVMIMVVIAIGAVNMGTRHRITPH